jgi:hypothetical protein
MGNPQKSWKGAPTTNAIQTNLNLYDKDNGCTVTQLPETFEGNPIYRVVFPAGTLPRIRTTFAYTAGQQYTGSIYYKVVSQGSHTPQLIFRENGFGTTYTSVSLTGTSWQRTNITHTFSGSGTSMFLLYQSSSAATTPTIIDFSMPQTELRSFATPYVAGTRSNTQAILDLTNNNTVTASSLTYASDGTFSFDGSANKVELFTSNSFISNGFTLSAFIKPLSAGGASFGRIFDKTNNDTGSAAGVFLYMNANPIVTLQINNGNSITTTSNSVPYSVWTNITATVTGSGNSVIYINGISNVSATLSLPNTITNTLPLTLGNRANATDRGFSGNISVATIYNRALSASEVQQNFNALRGRYGL